MCYAFYTGALTSSMSLKLVFSSESILDCRSVTVPLSWRFSSSM